MKDILYLYQRLPRLGSRQRAVLFALGSGRRLLAWLAVWMLLSLAGCGSFGRSPSSKSEGGFFGWHFYAPFDTTEVKTVAVFFKTNSFRRDVEKQLTEAVIKEITLRTPYKVVEAIIRRPTRCCRVRSLPLARTWSSKPLQTLPAS